MLRPLLGLSLALATVVSCAAEPAPPVAGGRVGSQVTPSLDHPSSMRATTSPFIEGKPCDLLTPDEAEALGLEPPGAPQRASAGRACGWDGTEFSLMIVISPARPLAQIETSRPGHRTTIAGRAASVARGEGEFAGLCEIALDVARVGSATVLLSRYDKDSAVACINTLRVTAFVHPRLPTG